MPGCNEKPFLFPPPVPTEKPQPPPADKAEEIKPKAREWDKHKAPWMEELKKNQMKKTSTVTERSGSAEVAAAAKGTSGSTDR